MTMIFWVLATQVFLISPILGEVIRLDDDIFFKWVGEPTTNRPEVLVSSGYAMNWCLGPKDSSIITRIFCWVRGSEAQPYMC